MKFLIILCFSSVLILNVLGQDKKPTKEQVQAAIKQLVDQLKEGIDEVNKAIKTEKDAKLKKFYQDVVKHLEALKKNKETCAAQLNKDGNVDKAIATINSLLLKHHQEMEAFHKKHPAKS